MSAARLLSLVECAERTSTTIRWWRRAVFERRIPYVKLGALVRIEESVLEELIEAGRSPARPSDSRQAEGPARTGPRRIDQRRDTG